MQDDGRMTSRDSLQCMQDSAAHNPFASHGCPHTLSISSASSNTRMRMFLVSNTRLLIQSRNFPCVPMTICSAIRARRDIP